MNNIKHNTKQVKSAVSLVELAIVILVLGILVAVVTGSNSLVKAAKIRKVVNEIDTIVTAHRAFEASYGVVAGDMIDAYDYFGTACAASASSADCNGDGDMRVDLNSAALNDASEYIRYFQHLKLANMLEGDYLGTGAVSTDQSTSCTAAAVLSSSCIRARNYNVPATNISDYGFYLVTYDSTHERNMITLGDTVGTSETLLNTENLLSSDDSKSIDLKMDNGLASSGKVRGKEGASNALCLDSGSEYDVPVTGINCYIEYVIQ